MLLYHGFCTWSDTICSKSCFHDITRDFALYRLLRIFLRQPFHPGFKFKQAPQRVHTHTILPPLPSYCYHPPLTFHLSPPSPPIVSCSSPRTSSACSASEPLLSASCSPAPPLPCSPGAGLTPPPSLLLWEGSGGQCPHLCGPWGTVGRERGSVESSMILQSRLTNSTTLLPHEVEEYWTIL